MEPGQLGGQHAAHGQREGQGARVAQPDMTGDHMEQPVSAEEEEDGGDHEGLIIADNGGGRCSSLVGRPARASHGDPHPPPVKSDAASAVLLATCHDDEVKVRFAVAPGGLGFDSNQFVEFVDELERLRFDTLWLSDVPLGATIDPLIGLALAGGRTDRLKLGANLVPLGRHPYLLAKELAQLDRVSGGRLLLSLVPGLGQPMERQLLGAEGSDRGRLIEGTMTLLRAFWSGGPVTHEGAGFACRDLVLPVLPVQQPLELWLGGNGPKALQRVGVFADGWLGSAMTPPEAATAVQTMSAAAVASGRALDPEHFGLSIPYGRVSTDEASLAYVRARRPEADPWDLLPVGAEALRDLIGALVGAGLSKFVLRPVGPMASVCEELEWLAEVVLPLQT